MSEENYSKASFDARHVQDLSGDPFSAQAGDYSFFVNDKGERCGMLIALPGRDGKVSVGACPFPNAPDNHPGWSWDGNVDKPTLSPSIHRLGSWHGFLKAGRFESV